jgi:hypothetical protein
MEMMGTTGGADLPAISRMYLSASCPELKAESVMSLSDTEEILLSEMERVVTPPPIQEEEQQQE